MMKGAPPGGSWLFFSIGSIGGEVERREEGNLEIGGEEEGELAHGAPRSRRLGLTSRWENS